MGKEIDSSLEKLITKLADTVKLDSFALFGGAVLDTLLHKPIADYDMGFESNGIDSRLKSVVETLKKQGFAIITEAKEHPIWNDKLAVSYTHLTLPTILRV